MKTLTALTAVAALLAGISIAGAQNTPTPNNPQPPSSINRGMTSTQQSGSEMAPSMQKGKIDRTADSGKFCLNSDAGSQVNCSYATLAQCNAAKTGNTDTCTPNPKTATTGSKSE